MLSINWQILMKRKTVFGRLKHFAEFENWEMNSRFGLIVKQDHKLHCG